MTPTRPRAPHPFEVGEAYRNRRGPYEVLELDEHADRMRVRYLEGDAVATLTIETQKRIWENMTGEERTAARRSAEANARSARSLGADFRGLSDFDFKTNVDGTRWRSRQGLGGRVARALSERTSLPFCSVAVYRWPVVLFSHRERDDLDNFEDGAPCAKYTIEVDEDGVYYGFYLERDPGRRGADWDWPRFMRAVATDPELVTHLENAETDLGARFVARSSTGTGPHFHYRNGLRMGARPLWSEDGASGVPMADRLRLLETIAPTDWGEIYVVGSQPKGAAIEAGEKIEQPIADLMLALLPLYRAATGARG